MTDELTQAEYADLLGSSSAASWARACKRVKAAHGGGYRCTHHRALDAVNQSWVCPSGCEPIPYKAAP